MWSATVCQLLLTDWLQSKKWKKKQQNKLKRNQYQEEVDEKKKISYILIMKDLLLSFNPIPIKWTQI